MVMPTKVQDEAELRRWLEEGRTYSWIRAQYLEKYNIEISHGTLVNQRKRMGIQRRRGNPRVQEMPWVVERRHQAYTPALMLRRLSKVRTGADPVSAEHRAELDKWLKRLERSNASVDYRPWTDEGFFYVERSDEDEWPVAKPSPEVKLRAPVTLDED